MLPIIETPKYTLEIPSTKLRVEYRPYLVKEEKILMLALESGDEDKMLQALKDVVNSCTFDKIDAGKLTMFDLEYVFAKLRSVSVGESTTIGLACKSCKETNEVKADLSAVELRGGTNIDTVKVNEEITVKMRFPTLNDIQSLPKESGDVAKVYLILEKCLDKVFYGDEVLEIGTYSSQEVKNFIESLPPASFTKVREFVENLPYTATDLDFNCTSCGEANHIEVKGLQSFFA